MTESKSNRVNVSYALRVNEVNAIYDHYAKCGCSNAAIFRKYIYPRFGMSIRTFYKCLKKGHIDIPETQARGLHSLSLGDSVSQLNIHAMT